MWEIPALAIINELRSRAALKDYGPFTLDVTYARAKAKMWEKVERLKKLPNLRISDFGTRRRHSFLWQRWCVEALKEGLGPVNFTGTSQRAARHGQRSRSARHQCARAADGARGDRAERGSDALGARTRCSRTGRATTAATC